MLFNGVLPKGKELGLVEALIQAGADRDRNCAGASGRPRSIGRRCSVRTGWQDG